MSVTSAYEAIFRENNENPAGMESEVSVFKSNNVANSLNYHKAHLNRWILPVGETHHCPDEHRLREKSLVSVLLARGF